MYSFQPIPVVDTLNDHTGFAVFGFIFFVIWCIMVASGEWKSWALAILLAVPLGVVGAISWNTGSIKTYANTPVQATLVGFTAESHNESRSSGKTHSTVTVHTLYVTYEVNGNVVVMSAVQGAEYPKTAILYKN